MAKKKTPREYEIGRGKPPVHSRFKPGQSGNPGGRKKGGRNLKTVLQQLMETEVPLTDHNGRRLATMLEALILRQMQSGLQGSDRAINSLLDRYARHCDQLDRAQEELPEEDEEILKDAIARRARQRARQPGTEKHDE
jgi:hypothetical protein